MTRSHGLERMNIIHCAYHCYFSLRVHSFFAHVNTFICLYIVKDFYSELNNMFALHPFLISVSHKVHANKIENKHQAKL